MKVVLTSLGTMAVALLLAATWAWAQPAADRPPGVPVDRWIALGDNAGIVLTEVPVDPAAPDGDLRLRLPWREPAEGVLMGKLDGVWVPIEIASPGPRARVQPLYK